MAGEKDDDDDDEKEIKPEIRTHFQPYQETKAGAVEGCWDNDGFFFDIYREFGEVWRNPEECNRKTCTRDGTIVEEVCPEIEVPEGCIRVLGNADEYQDFPYCCDRVACPGDEDYWEDDPLFPPECTDKYCVRQLGEVWSEHKYGICNRKRCKRNKYNEPTVFEEVCPEIEVPKGCELEPYPDLTKEFPDCCEKVVCPPGHPLHKSENSDDNDKASLSETQAVGVGGSDRKNVEVKPGTHVTTSNGEEANNPGTRQQDVDLFKQSIAKLFEKGAIVLFDNRNDTSVSSDLKSSNETVHKSSQKLHKTKTRGHNSNEVTKSKKNRKKHKKKREIMKTDEDKIMKTDEDKIMKTDEDTVIVNVNESENNQLETDNQNKSKIRTKEKSKRRKTKDKTLTHKHGNDRKSKSSGKIKKHKNEKSKDKAGERDNTDVFSRKIKYD